MKSFFKIYFKKEFIYLYPHWSALALVLFTDFATQGIYYLTSLSFNPQKDLFLNDTNYFSFVLSGELILFIPLYFLTVFCQIIRQTFNEDTFENFLFSKYSFFYLVCMQGLAGSLHKVIQLLFSLIIAYFIFKLKVPFIFWLKIIPFLIMSTPFFLALGMLSASILVIWGRGERWVYLFSSASSFLAGVYFPLTIFPSNLSFVLEHLNPFGFYLNFCRKLMANSSQLNQIIPSFVLFFICGLVFFMMSYIIFNRAVAVRLRENRKHFIQN